MERLSKANNQSQCSRVRYRISRRLFSKRLARQIIRRGFGRGLTIALCILCKIMQLFSLRWVEEITIPRTDEEVFLPSGRCPREWHQRVFRGDQQVMKPVCLDFIRDKCLLTRTLCDFCDRKCDARQMQPAVCETGSTHVVKQRIKI